MEHLECPHCGGLVEFDFEDEGYSEDEIEPTPVGMKISMDEIIDYVFTALVQEGITPSGEEIFKVIMHYLDYVESRVAHYIGEVTTGGQEENDHD